MENKHYDISYLEDTAKAMQNLKRSSYQLFQDVHGEIIDLGCGTGMDVIMMAKLFGDSKHFTGIDHDGAMIEKARSSAAGMDNISFLKQEVYNLPFEPEAVAGVRAERLFQHLSHPETVLKEIHRVLKKGHPVVIVETDWNSLSFYNVDLGIEKKVHDYLTEEKVVNGMAAKKLASGLSVHGFKDIRIELFPLLTRSFQEACAYLWIDKIITEMKEKDILSQEAHDTFLQDLKKADANHYFLCSLNAVIVSGIK